MTFSNRSANSGTFLIGDLPKIYGRRILISGVNGFLGCHVATSATKAGAEVVGIDLELTTARAEKVRESLGGAEFKIHEVANLNAQKINNILSKFSADMIIHLAGFTRRENTPEAWTESAKGNVLLTAAILSAVSEKAENSRPAIVMAGSQMEYGRAPMPWTEERSGMPDNPYGAGKVAATELIRAAVRSTALRGCVMRFPIIFGPGQTPTMIIPELICKALKGVAFSMTKGGQQRRFLFVGDAARFLLTLANSLYNNEKIPSLINAPACQPLSILEVVRTLMTFLPNTAELRVGALAERPGELMHAWPDSSLADSMNIFSPTPLEKSLALTAGWYMQNPWFVDSMPY